jgi:hypothetical protein
VKRLLLSVIGIAAVLTLPACGHGAAKTPTGATNPVTATSSGALGGGSPSPGGPSSPSDVKEFSVDGAGPYQIGSKLTDLQATAGLDNVTAGGASCPQDTTAQGTGEWAGVQLSFGTDGVLYVAVNKSTTIPTPSGAWLGTPVAQLKTIYVGIQTEALTAGTRKGFLVTTLSGGGILFDLNAQGLVQSMAAGDATYLKTSFQAGTNFCS